MKNFVDFHFLQELQEGVRELSQAQGHHSIPPLNPQQQQFVLQCIMVQHL